jgi:hypothetical protein
MTDVARKWILFIFSFGVLLGSAGGGILGFNYALNYVEDIKNNTAFRIAHETEHKIRNEYGHHDSGIKAPNE